jgi:serine/threonine-protein kinase
VVEERSRWWIPVVVVLVILAILGIFLWVLAHNLLNNDNPHKNGNGNSAAQVAVPNVVGQKVGPARTTLQAQNLNLVIGQRVQPTDTSQVPGTIVSQDPVANTKVDKGSDVTVTVVGQPAQVAVPQLPADQTADQAAALLTQAGLTPGQTIERSSDTVAADKVIAFDPPSGTQVDPSTPVNIIVSTGPSTVAVPNVVCLSFPAAQNQLRNAGLNPVVATQTVDVNPQCQLGNKVAQQDPAAGSTAQPGDTVTLYGGAESTGPTGGTGTT